MDLLKQYSWPGNVRELENICERAHVLSFDDLISAELIAPWLQPVGVIRGEARCAAPVHGSEIHDITEFICNGARRLEDIERDAILATLEKYGGHRQRSASALGIGVRTLGLKLKKWKESNLISPTT